MKNYSFSIHIPASQEKDATDKMKALTILASSLTVVELTKLAHVIKHDPVKTALAKKYLGV